MADQKEQNTSRRSLIEDTLEGISGFFRALAQELHSSTAHEQMEQKLAAVSQEMESLEGAVQELLKQDTHDRQVLLDTVQRVGRLETLIVERLDALEQSLHPEDREQIDRWQVLLKRLRALILVLIGATGSALYQSLIQSEVYPQLMETLKHLDTVRFPGEAPIAMTQQPPKAAPRVEPGGPPATPQPTAPKSGNRMTDPHGVTMVYVPPGTFAMGSQDFSDATPHPITIAKGFWMDLTPVTNAMYARFVKAGGYQNRDLWTPGGWQWVQANKKAGPNDYEGFTEPDQPRVGVTWFEAYAYCRWRGGRLPTEAEWEWAARGPENKVYPWGKDFDASRVIYSGNSGGKTAVVNAQTRLAGASWVGALDMSGNVWEWVNSLYKPYPYNATDGRESLGDDKETRVLRGGSWNDNDGDSLRAAYRNWVYPTGEDGINGFRCARSS